MKNDNELDLESLGRLKVLSPDPVRVERVRARCSARLVRDRQRTERADVGTGMVRRVLAPVVVFGFCALYFASLVTTTLRLQGVIH